MKDMIPLLTFAVLISCAKEKEPVIAQKTSESVNRSVVDSVQSPTMKNAEYSAAFIIVPIDIAPQQGRSVFTQNGKTLFYFDQNANKGLIRIDGKDYNLDRFDFNENNYSLYGNGIVIEASNGDFKEMTGDCLYGVFPEVKVSLNGKILNLSNIKLQDCPAY
ncbi:MAG: hypothetical protein ACXWBY_03900 [Kaistella sp.]